jgi:Fe-S-cluster containining protein
MSADDAFEDDVDTVPQCTGECCDPVRLTGEDYWDMSRNPEAHHNARYILNMLVAQGPVPRHGRVEFACRHFDQGTRLCGAYDRRPLMCREFPESGVCVFCGGRFATDKQPQGPADEGPTAVESAKRAAMRSLIAEEMRSQHTGTSRSKPRKRGRR